MSANHGRGGLAAPHKRSALIANSATALSVRIATYQPMPTNHSTLPKHYAFMSRAVAYNQPIGFCDAYEKPDGFSYALIRDADWTQTNDVYCREGELTKPPKPSQINSETVAEAVTEADQERRNWGGA